MDADGGGSGGGAAAAAVPDPVQRPGAAQAVGTTALTAQPPIARILPPQQPRRGRPAREPQWARIAGIGMAVAALALLVAVLLGHTEPSRQDGRDDDRGAENERKR